MWDGNENGEINNNDTLPQQTIPRKEHSQSFFANYKIILFETKGLVGDHVERLTYPANTIHPTNIVDDGPTLKHLWIDVSDLLPHHHH